MSSADSCQAQRTSTCSIPSMLPTSASILMRCPDPKAHPNCSPPSVADPEVPGVEWVLCHAWIQTMPRARSVYSDTPAEPTEDDTSTTDHDAGAYTGAASPLRGSPVQNKNDDACTQSDGYVLPSFSSSPTLPVTSTLLKANEWQLLDARSQSDQGPSLQKWCANCPNKMLESLPEQREYDTVNPVKAEVILPPRMQRTGSAPIERDYAVPPQCPSANQWKTIWDSLEKTKLPRPPRSTSEYSRISKVVRRPLNDSPFTPVQGKMAGPDRKTRTTVITDESSDSSSSERSVETDTTKEDSDRSSESGSDSEIMSVSRGSSDSVGVHDYHEDSGVAKRHFRTINPAPRYGKSDKRDMKPTDEHYNVLGLSPHTDVESAKEAFIEKVGKICTIVL